MSIRVEQNRALLLSRDLLRDLIDPAKTPKVPLGVRVVARRCLRHYPFFDQHGSPVFSPDDSTPWQSEIERALLHAEMAMSGAMKDLDFRVWDEIEDAVDCLRAAAQSNRRASESSKAEDDTKRKHS